MSPKWEMILIRVGLQALVAWWEKRKLKDRIKVRSGK